MSCMCDELCAACEKAMEDAERDEINEAHALPAEAWDFPDAWLPI